MRKIIIAMAAMAAAFTIASCNKEQLSEPGENAEGNCIVRAITESNLTRTSLSGNDTDGYEVFWSEGDTFILEGKTFTLIDGAGTAIGTFQGTVPSMNSTFVAYSPASYNGSNWPVKQKYAGSNSITGSPMTAEVKCFMEKITDEKIVFKNVGGILRLTVKGTAKVTSITVCTDNIPNITLDCGDGVDLNNTDGTVFHIAMPLGTYTGTSILFTTSDSRHCVKTLKADKPLVITRSKISPASIRIDKWSSNSQAPDGALAETFTVSADGKKVFFSKGNLYWDGSVYGFENNQYDYSVAGHQSSFFWSNTAAYARGSEWNLDTNAPIAFFTNADEVTANAGFTANGQTGLWRTLSKDEWDYLIKRENGIGEATINGVKGVIIFPDEYAGQTDGLTSIPEGCVFLPAGEDDDVISLYWSSTPRLDLSSSIPAAAGLRYVVGAWPPSVVADGMPAKNTVRLVTDVPDIPIPAPTFNVTFDMNGHGVAPAVVAVPYHTTITTKPADPTTEGYTFWGWFKDKACTIEWDFANDLVTSNTTLYAKWQFNGALPFTFTVGSGKKVYFSWGNLWYGKTSEEAESATFNFEANQYDFVINKDKSTGQNLRDDNHISHFMWSKDANVARALQYNDPLASEDDAFFTNANQTTANQDFTVNGQKGIWRLLSIDEWRYLIENNGSLAATINDIEGRIIFYDGYSGSRTGLKTIPNGCLFLPGAGQREGSNGSTIIKNVDNGLYWTSTSYANSYAYHLLFNLGVFDLDVFFYYSCAYAVRLVTDVK